MIDLSLIHEELNAAEIVIAVSEILQAKNLADINRERIECLKNACNLFVPADKMPDFLQNLLLGVVAGIEKGIAAGTEKNEVVN